MTDEQFYAEFRKWHPSPYFQFADVLPLGDIQFERLTARNFVPLFLMFGEDKNDFTEQYFKTYEGARKYAFELENISQFSPKHGGQDWYFKTANQYMGILHLYDLSLEKFSMNNTRCWIGFHTAPPFRRKGITSKVIRHFIRHIFNHYTQINFIHAMTLKENQASQSFLLKNGFHRDERERISKEHSFFVLSRHGLL